MNPTTTVRKPLEAVQIKAEFVGRTTRQDVIDGDAILAVRNGDGEVFYRVLALFDGPTLAGWRVTKVGTEEGYAVAADLRRCTCPDNTHRPDRPGGCRHMAALRMALPTVTQE